MTFLSDKYLGGSAKVPWATEKESFTPTCTNWAGATLTGYKWRVGNLLYMDIKVTLSSAPTGSVVFDIPDSLSADSNLLATSENPIQCHAYALESGVGWSWMGGVVSSSDYTGFYLVENGGNVGINGITATTPHGWGSSDKLQITVAIPISGWDVERNLTPRGSTFRGASVTHDMGTPQDFTSGASTYVEFNSENYDTDSFHDNATNNTRLSVPNGVSKIKLHVHLTWPSNSTGYRQTWVRKNGATIPSDGIYEIRNAVNGARTGLSMTSAIMEVVGGVDYFEVGVVQNSTSTLNLDSTYPPVFAIEVIE